MNNELWEQLHRDLTARALEASRQQMELMFGPEEYRQRSHVETRERSAEWLAQRAEFVAEWEALTERGREAGFLEPVDCTDCRGELEPTTDTTEVLYVDDETREEWAKRIEQLPPVRILGGWVGGTEAQRAAQSGDGMVTFQVRHTRTPEPAVTGREDER